MPPLLSCRGVITHLPLHEEGGDPWLARVFVRVHLFACGDCDRYVGQLRAVRVALAALGGSPGPGAVTDPVSAETKAQLTARFRSWRGARTAGGS